MASGIPNIGNTCFINAAIQALRPLHEDLKRSSSQTAQGLSDIYGSDKISKDNIGRFLDNLTKKPEFKDINIGYMGDSPMFLVRLILSMCNEDPYNSYPLFKTIRIYPENCKCGMVYGGKKLSQEYIVASTSKIFETINEATKEQYEILDKCPRCGRTIPSWPCFDVPKYIVVHTVGCIYNRFDEKLTINVKGKTINFTMVSLITGGTGHAICHACVDGKWHRYDDNWVNDSSMIRAPINIIAATFKKQTNKDTKMRDEENKTTLEEELVELCKIHDTNVPTKKLIKLLEKHKRRDNQDTKV